MVNFRKYREWAFYPDNDFAPCSGRDAYAKFFSMVADVLSDTDGQVTFSAEYEADVIVSGSGEWDDIVIVQYPSRQSFIDAMAYITSGGFEEAMLHRFAGLEKFALIATRPTIHSDV